MNKLSKNIKINYIYHFFNSVNVTQGIWMIYLVSKGLSLLEVGLLEGIFHVTSFIMETPTGAVADIFGRKVSRLVGLLFSMLGGVLMLVSGSFIGYALSFVLTALAYNFESGAGEALVFDSLKADGKDHMFMKVTGHNETIFQGAGVLALVLGGIIGSIQYSYVFAIGIGMAFLTLIVGLFFKEPPVEGKKEHPSMGHAIKAQYVDSIHVFKTNGKLSYLILFSALLGMMVTLSFFYLQVAWKEAGFIEWQIGIILAISSLFAILGAQFAARVDKKYGEKKLLRTLPFVIGLMLLLFVGVKSSIVAFAVVSFVDSLIFVALRDYINKIIPSDKRATIISFESTCFSFFMILIFPLFGFVSDHIGMQITFVMLGVLMLVLSIVNAFILNKRLEKSVVHQK